MKQKANMFRPVERSFMTVRLRLRQLTWCSGAAESDGGERKAESKWSIKANDKIFDPDAAN
jgi:hypothetical protein